MSKIQESTCDVIISFKHYVLEEHNLYNKDLFTAIHSYEYV